MNYAHVVQRLFGRTPVTTFLAESARDDLGRAAVEAGAAVLADFGDAPRAIAQLRDNRFAAIGRTHAVLVGAGEPSVALLPEGDDEEESPPVSVRDMTPAEKGFARQHVKHGRKTYRFGKFRPGMRVKWKDESWIVYDARYRGPSKFELLLVSPDYTRMASNVLPAEIGESESDESNATLPFYLGEFGQVSESQSFTAAHLEQLRAQFAQVKTIDPSSPTYDKMIKLLDGMTQHQLKQVAGANIKFLSKLALNRVKKPVGEAKEPMDTGDGRPGDKVVVIGNVAGRNKRGKISSIAPSGSFATVRFPNGEERSYHLSDLSLVEPFDESVSPAWGRYASLVGESFTVFDRYTALGIPRPDLKTMCQGPCDGTGFVPVRQGEQDEELRRRWESAERAEQAADGWHFVACPACEGSRLREGVDEADDEIDRVSRELEYARADARQPDLNAKAKAKLLRKVAALDAKFEKLLAARKAASSDNASQDSEGGKWRTTASGHKIYIDGGKITKGNPHVLKAAGGKSESVGEAFRMEAGFSYEGKTILIMRDQGNFAFVVDGEMVEDGFSSRAATMKAAKKHVDEMPVMAEAAPGEGDGMRFGAARMVGGEKAVPFSALKVGAKFHFPKTTTIYTKTSELGKYAAEDGRKFKTGVHTAVIPEPVNPTDEGKGKHAYAVGDRVEVRGEGKGKIVRLRHDSANAYEVSFDKGGTKVVWDNPDGAAAVGFRKVVKVESVEEARANVAGWAITIGADRATVRSPDGEFYTADTGLAGEIEFLDSDDEPVRVPGAVLRAVQRMLSVTAESIEEAMPRMAKGQIWTLSYRGAPEEPDAWLFVTEVQKNGAPAGVKYDVMQKRATFESFNGFSGKFGRQDYDAFLEMVVEDRDQGALQRVTLALSKAKASVHDFIESAELPKRDQDSIAKMAPGAIRQAQIDKARRDAHYAKPTTAVAADWQQFEGILVMRRPGSPFVAVPVTGKKSSKLFDVIRVEGKREHVAQIKSAEVGGFLARLDRQDEGVYNANDPTPFDSPEVAKAKLAARDAEHAAQKRAADAARAPAEKLASTLTPDERKVLAVMTSYIPSARRQQSRLSSDAYDAALAGLKAKKLVNAQGALTPATRELMRALDMKTRRELFGESLDLEEARVRRVLWTVKVGRDVWGAVAFGPHIFATLNGEEYDYEDGEIEGLDSSREVPAAVLKRLAKTKEDFEADRATARESIEEARGIPHWRTLVDELLELASEIKVETEVSLEVWRGNWSLQLGPGTPQAGRKSNWAQGTIDPGMTPEDAKGLAIDMIDQIRTGRQHDESVAESRADALKHNYTEALARSAGVNRCSTCVHGRKLSGTDVQCERFNFRAKAYGHCSAYASDAADDEQDESLDDSDYGVRWSEFTRDGRVVNKQKFFASEKVRDRYIERISQGDNFKEIIAVTSPTNRGESIDESFEAEVLARKLFSVLVPAERDEIERYKKLPNWEKLKKTHPENWPAAPGNPSGMYQRAQKALQQAVANHSDVLNVGLMYNLIVDGIVDGSLKSFEAFWDEHEDDLTVEAWKGESIGEAAYGSGVEVTPYPVRGSKEKMWLVRKDGTLLGYVTKFNDTKTNTNPWKAFRYKSPTKGESPDNPDADFLGSTYQGKLKGAVAAVVSGQKLVQDTPESIEEALKMPGGVTKADAGYRAYAMLPKNASAAEYEQLARRAYQAGQGLDPGSVESYYFSSLLLGAQGAARAAKKGVAFGPPDDPIVTAAESIEEAGDGWFKTQQEAEAAAIKWSKNGIAGVVTGTDHRGGFHVLMQVGLQHTSPDDVVFVATRGKTYKGDDASDFVLDWFGKNGKGPRGVSAHGPTKLGDNLQLPLLGQVEEGYQHVHFDGSKSARAKVMLAGGKTKSVQGRTFDGVLLVHPIGNYQWGVTHIPTGLGLVPPPGFWDDRAAVKFAKAASALGGWDFVDAATVPPELSSKMGTLIASFRSDIRKTGGTATKTESVEEANRNYGSKGWTVAKAAGKLQLDKGRQPYRVVRAEFDLNDDGTLKKVVAWEAHHYDDRSAKLEWDTIPKHVRDTIVAVWRRPDTKTESDVWMRTSRTVQDGAETRYVDRLWRSDGEILERIAVAADETCDWKAAGRIKPELLQDMGKLCEALASTRSKLEAAGWTVESYNPPA